MSGRQHLGVAQRRPIKPRDGARHPKGFRGQHRGNRRRLSPLATTWGGPSVGTQRRPVLGARVPLFVVHLPRLWLSDCCGLGSMAGPISAEVIRALGVGHRRQAQALFVDSLVRPLPRVPQGRVSYRQCRWFGRGHGHDSVVSGACEAVRRQGGAWVEPSVCGGCRFFRRVMGLAQDRCGGRADACRSRHTDAEAGV